MGYLSNHAKHAIIALDRLQAPESRVQQYWDSYTTLTPYNLRLHRIDDDWESVKRIRDDVEWLELRGKKQKWQQQVAYMNQQLEHKYQGDPEKLVKAYATPDLLRGLAGALTHGGIIGGERIGGEDHDGVVCRSTDQNAPGFLNSDRQRHHRR